MAANSNTAVPADFIPAKLRSEEARETKYRIVRHQSVLQSGRMQYRVLNLCAIGVSVVMHLKADEVLFNGETCRFCQKCTKFHNVNAFENNRRACLRSLNRLASQATSRVIAPASAENTLNSYAPIDDVTRRGTSRGGDNDTTQRGQSTHLRRMLIINWISLRYFLSYNKWYQGCAMIAKNWNSCKNRS